MDRWTTILICSLVVLCGIGFIKEINKSPTDDYKFACLDGHVYFKQKASDDFWTKTGRECK